VAAASSRRSVIDGRFTGADRQAADAMRSAIEAMVALGVRSEELEQRVKGCDDFVVGHAYAAFLAELAGDPTRAARAARRARRSQRAITRRERQLVEVLLLVIDGDRQRAAALAAEHIAEFGEDRDALAPVATWHPHPD
jgi:hypothetical protein